MDNSDIFIKTEEQPPEKTRKKQKKPMAPEKKGDITRKLKKR